MTPAIFQFTDNYDTHAVYVHCDGYPDGAAAYVLKAFYRAWTLPRFEANELAAAFVAANKDKAGGVRLVNGPVENDEHEYVYNIFQAKNGQMIVKAFKDGTEFYYGRLKDFCLNYTENRSEEIVNIFHGEISTTDVKDIENKKQEIRNAVKTALDTLNKMKDEIEDIAVSVGV